jgi:hypothetical protein
MTAATLAMNAPILIRCSFRLRARVFYRLDKGINPLLRFIGRQPVLDKY